MHNLTQRRKSIMHGRLSPKHKLYLLFAHLLIPHLLFSSLPFYSTIYVMTKSKATIMPSKVPSITDLRAALDYGDPKLDRCKDFYDDIRLFRRQYRTTSGLLGTDAYDWKSPEHQSALDEITRAYLLDRDRGRHYWPDDETSPNYNKYQYTDGPKL